MGESNDDAVRGQLRGARQDALRAAACGDTTLCLSGCKTTAALRTANTPNSLTLSTKACGREVQQSVSARRMQ